MSYNHMANWNWRLGISFDMNKPLTFKMLHRPVAAALLLEFVHRPSQKTTASNPMMEEVRS